MRSPDFWRRNGLLAGALAPIGRLYAAATARRVARPGWCAPVPVICIGNATAGGTGKTTVALDLAARLIARGLSVAFLTRGYRGSLTGRVDPTRQPIAMTGDEARLLAAMAPTYMGPDRAITAQAAIAGGATCLVMDDGLQNPTVQKRSLLVIDGAAGIGNGRIIPAGPLREPLAAAARRCRAAVIIGPDDHGIARSLMIPVLHAHLECQGEIAGLRLFAFAGIGRPGKFHDTLRAAGADVAGIRDFPDHHRFTDSEFAAVLHAARRLGAEAVTTPKDAIRLTADQRAKIRIADVRLVWDDPAGLDAVLDAMLEPV